MCILTPGLIFMTWNANLSAKDYFERVRFIQAHTSIFNYNIISICETSLNDLVELPETLLNDYTFVPAYNPSNTMHGGVGLFSRIACLLLSEMICCLMSQLLLNSNLVRKKYSFQFHIEALHSTIPHLNS